MSHCVLIYMFNQPGGPHFLTRLGTCKKREGDKGGREREEGKEREKGKQGREEEREGRRKFKTSYRRCTSQTSVGSHYRPPANCDGFTDVITHTSTLRTNCIPS